MLTLKNFFMTISVSFNILMQKIRVICNLFSIKLNAFPTSASLLAFFVKQLFPFWELQPWNAEIFYDLITPMNILYSFQHLSCPEETVWAVTESSSLTLWMHWLFKSTRGSRGGRTKNKHPEEQLTYRQQKTR